MLRERIYTVGAMTINCATATEAGPPMLLVHGVTSRWQSWLPVMPRLGLRWRLHALDLRGHGRSGHAPDAAYRIEEYADDVVAFLRREIGAPTVLVGHSLGAIIATSVAARAPELLCAVVLEDPPLAAFRHQSLRERPEVGSFTALRDLGRRGLAPAELRAALATMRPTSDPAALAGWARSIGSLDPEVLTLVIEDRAKEGYDQDAALGTIAAPTLLLQGEPSLGGALADEDARRAASLLRNGMHIRLHDAGHGIHSDDPARFCRIVHDFLASALSAEMRGTRRPVAALRCSFASHGGVWGAYCLRPSHAQVSAGRCRKGEAVGRMQYAPTIGPLRFSISAFVVHSL